MSYGGSLTDDFIGSPASMPGGMLKGEKPADTTGASSDQGRG